MRRLIAFAFPALLLVTGLVQAAPNQPPNVLILLADDLGYGDIGLHGGPVATPNIDGLARAGLRLNRFYVNPLCSPSRAALLTSCYPSRVGAGPLTEGVLDAKIPTFASAFRAAGYHTGLFGKWHNGNDPLTPEFREINKIGSPGVPEPEDVGPGVNAYGFDEAWNYHGGGADQFTRRTKGGNGPITWWHNKEYRPNDPGYTSELIAQHAVEFISAKHEKPFLAYVPFQAIHTPCQTPEGWLDRVPASITDPEQRNLYACVAFLDHSVGRILEALKKNGLDRNTIVFFTSDNGGTKYSRNAPFRGGKATLFEGGIHVPAFIRWPGHIRAGSSVDSLAAIYDVWPTLVGLASQGHKENLKAAKAPSDCDGRDLSPGLLDPKKKPEARSLYWSFITCDALIDGNWKLLRFLDHNELYDLAKDSGEKTNLADSNAEQVGKMSARMDEEVLRCGLELSHRPSLRPIEKPAPDGDVLAITVRQEGEVKPKDRLFLDFRGMVLGTDSRDRLEYDIAYAKDSLPAGAGYFMFRHLGEGKRELVMVPASYVDQFGRPQTNNPPVKEGPGHWERRVVGLSARAPVGANGHAITFFGSQSGTYRVYIDNVVIRHMDGTITPIWSSRKNGSLAKPAPSAAFPEIKVEIIDAAQVSL